MESRNFTVYRHIAPNGKMYVGVTRRPPKERWDSGHGYRGQPYFWRAIQKYGWKNFEHEILLEGLTEEEASWAEEVFIECWDLTNRSKGYNLRTGGRKDYTYPPDVRERMSNIKRGQRHTQETIEKIRAAHLGENNHFYGKRHTEESKAKMRRAKLGRKLSEETKIKLRQNKPNKRMVNQIDPKTHQVINTFSSIRGAADYVGVKRSNISCCCRGVYATSAGYYWEYADK